MTQAQETEGVIKFRLDFQSAEPPDGASYAELNAWRTLLFKLGLTGIDPARYGGLAYGNVSRRLQNRSFLISGTQTGGLPWLNASHYCVADDCDIGANWLVAHGPIRPSSEALTHGAVYQVSAQTNFVFHVHSPEIWRAAGTLGIPMTHPDAAYGSLEMAREVAALLKDDATHIIAMGGHRDGLLSVGEHPEDAALPMIQMLAQALFRDGRAKSSGYGLP